MKTEDLSLVKLPNNTSSRGCDHSVDACCGGSSTASEFPQTAQIEIKITIDGNEITATSHDMNLVEAAERANIRIPAPCYRTKKTGVCCKACVVEIGGKLHYACGTAPRDGMNIVVNRDDLKAIRKKRLLQFKEDLHKGTTCGCSS